MKKLICLIFVVLLTGCRNAPIGDQEYQTALRLCSDMGGMKSFYIKEYMFKPGKFYYTVTCYNEATVTKVEEKEAL